jgi:hypothetical protein
VLGARPVPQEPGPAAIEARARSRTRSLAVVPAKMPVWSSRAWGPCKAASRHGPRTAQPAQMAFAWAAWAAWGAWPGSGKNSSGSTSLSETPRRQASWPELGGRLVGSCWRACQSWAIRSPAVAGPARRGRAAGRCCAGRRPAPRQVVEAAAARDRGPRGSSSGVPPRRPAGSVHHRSLPYWFPQA